MKSACIIFLLLAVFEFNVINSANILLITPLATKSEKNAFIPLANALGSRGHKVTVLSRFQTKYESPNVQDVLVLDDPTYLEAFSDPIESRKVGISIMIGFDCGFMTEACHKIYQNENFQKLMDPSVKYDLIISNTFFQQCLHGFIHKKKAPLILISTMGLWAYSQSLVGQHMETSFVPSPFFMNKERMTFSERLTNTVLEWYWSYYTINTYNKDMEAVYRKYLGQDTPSVYEIDRSVSMIFENTHWALTPPRPRLPNVIETGGSHCRPAKPVPKDLEEFLSKGPFVFFSMGSIVKSDKMSEEWKTMFLNVFRKFKDTRFLWKYESDDIKDRLPANVKTGKWLPQQDVLGHKNCRIFITHSGGFSTQEATYHGVPVIGMPIFVDQNLNSQHAVSRGFAIELEILDLNEEMFENAIREVLTNKKYAENAKKASSYFRDQPQTPLERAVFWAEYVIRHKGAKQMESASKDLSYIQYHLIDVYLFLLALVLIPLYFLFKILAAIFSLFGKKSQASSKKVKKN